MRDILTGTVSRDNKQIKSCMKHIHVRTPSGDQCQSPSPISSIPLLSVSSYQSEEVQGGQGSQIAGYRTNGRVCRRPANPPTHIAQLWFIFYGIKSSQD